MVFAHCLSASRRDWSAAISATVLFKNSNTASLSLSDRKSEQKMCAMDSVQNLRVDSAKSPVHGPGLLTTSTNSSPKRLKDMSPGAVWFCCDMSVLVCVMTVCCGKRYVTWHIGCEKRWRLDALDDGWAWIYSTRNTDIAARDNYNPHALAVTRCLRHMAQRLRHTSWRECVWDVDVVGMCILHDCNNKRIIFAKVMIIC